MNEYEYLNDTIAREAAYDEGYSAGKQAAAEEIFADIEKALDTHFTKLNYADGTCTFVFHRDLEIELADLKKKYGVK